MRSLVPLASLLCLLAACAGELDAGTNNGAGRISAGGTSNQGGGDSAAGAGAAGSSGGAGQGGTAGSGGTGDAGAAGSAAGQSGTAGSGGAGSGRKKGYLGAGNFGEEDTINKYRNTPTVYFHDVVDRGLTPPYCTEVPHGSCRYITCGKHVEEPLTLDAGTITVTGASISPMVISRGEGFYEQVTPALPTNAPIVQGGEQILVSSTGAEVPAFSVSGTVPMPIRIAGLPPQHPVIADIDTTQDINLTMTGSTEGDVTFAWYAFGTDSELAYLSCNIPASQTSFTIAASTLAKLKGFGDQGVYRVLHRTVTDTQVGDWDISLGLFNPVQYPDGTALPALNPIRYQ